MQNNFVNRREQELEYAGFWARLAAYCIDCAIVWAGLLFVKLVLGIVSLSGGSVLQAHILFRYSLGDMILYVLQVLYFILITYGTGTTPGKRLLNLRVVNADLSPDLTLINVVYRETVGRFLCGLSIGIGYIMAGVDREKRGLHDMLCDTRVVYAKKIKVLPKYQAPQYYPPVPRPEPGPGPMPMPPYGNPPRKDPPAGSSYDGAVQGRAPMPPYDGPVQTKPPISPNSSSMQRKPPMPPDNDAMQGKSLEPLYHGPLDGRPSVSDAPNGNSYQEKSSGQNIGAGQVPPEETSAVSEQQLESADRSDQEPR